MDPTDVHPSKIKLPKLVFPSVDSSLIRENRLQIVFADNSYFATDDDYTKPVIKTKNQSFFLNQLHMGASVTGTSNKAAYWMVFTLFTKSDDPVEALFLVQPLLLDNTLQQPDFVRALAFALTSTDKPQLDVQCDLTYVRPKSKQVDGSVITLPAMYITQTTCTYLSSVFTAVVDPLSVIEPPQPKRMVDAKEGMECKLSKDANSNSFLIPKTMSTQQFTYFQLVFYSIVLCVLAYFSPPYFRFVFDKLNTTDIRLLYPDIKLTCPELFKTKQQIGNSFVVAHFSLLLAFLCLSLFADKRLNATLSLNYVVLFFALLVALGIYQTKLASLNRFRYGDLLNRRFIALFVNKMLKYASLWLLVLLGLVFLGLMYYHVTYYAGYTLVGLIIYLFYFADDLNTYYFGTG
jgi:hypothetical protein